MQRHHEIEFAQFMEAIFLNGAASMRWDRVCMWFNAEQVGDTEWKQIHAKWLEVCKANGYVDDVAPIFCYTNPSALVIVREGFGDEDVIEITAEGAEEIDEAE
ncbi:hypothetical protein [Dyella acidiphila]|uniref:Uncharacterized protein n=1 Tax=Dyella acidiphila TaxID=2775866 RepID=A0ABR9GA71_9GAMM|nr:hypothetical protein [Dyella acidiphila]MBE1160924.1 hypothetical protein [Dyella acidiphila]